MEKQVEHLFALVSLKLSIISTAVPRPPILMILDGQLSQLAGGAGSRCGLIIPLLVGISKTSSRLLAHHLILLTDFLLRSVLLVKR